MLANVVERYIMDKKALNQDKKKSIGFVMAIPVAMVIVMLFILASSLPSSSPTNKEPIADGTAVIINKKHTEAESTFIGPIDGVIIPIDTPESFVLDFNDSEGSPHLGYVSFETFEEVQVNDEICIHNGVIHELNKCD